MNKLNYHLTKAILLLLLVGTVACDDILSVNNPGAIDESELSNPGLEQTIINGVVGEFQYTHSYTSLYTGIFSDEFEIDHTYAPTFPVALRTIDESNVYGENVYSFWQRSRASADDAVERLEEINGEEAWSSLNMLTALTYGGYSYILIGETFGSAPINISRAYSSEELFEFATERFSQALEVADNAENAGSGGTDVDRLRNFANLGMARAYLQLGDMGNAEQYALEVDEDFEMWVQHSDNSSRQYNPFFDPTSGSNNRYLSPGTRFQNLDDPRVPHTDERLESLVEGTLMYIPYIPYSFQGWEAGETQVFSRTQNIRIGSGLEARYIIAEARGDDGYTLDLVNERRDFVGQDPVSYSGDELFEELREQRARDFYMTGRRLGDLRRYNTLYGIDEFPTGEDPFLEMNYGDAEYFPIPLSERNSNPNL